MQKLMKYQKLVVIWEFILDFSEVNIIIETKIHFWDEIISENNMALIWEMVQSFTVQLEDRLIHSLFYLSFTGHFLAY